MTANLKSNISTKSMNAEARLKKKILQLVQVVETDPLDWHSIEHLSRDIGSLATAVKSNPELYKKP